MLQNVHPITIILHPYPRHGRRTNKHNFPVANPSNFTTANSPQLATTVAANTTSASVNTTLQASNTTLKATNLPYADQYSPHVMVRAFGHPLLKIIDEMVSDWY